LTDRSFRGVARAQAASGAAVDLGSYEPSFALRGPVTLANLKDIRRRGEDALTAAGPRAAMDISGLTGANSAALAVLMAWFRQAQALGKSVVFTGVPTELLKIIELSGMAEILPLADGPAPGAASQPADQEVRK
jgi:phospholipid transport system transporter-binding protein